MYVHNLFTFHVRRKCDSKDLFRVMKERKKTAKGIVPRFKSPRRLMHTLEGLIVSGVGSILSHTPSPITLVYGAKPFSMPDGTTTVRYLVATACVFVFLPNCRF